LRKLLLTAAALAIAAPAMAQPAPYSDPRDEELARSLPTPAEAEAVGDALGRAAEAIMEVDVAPVVDAIDPTGRSARGGRDRTIGDMARRDDPHAEERIRHSVDAMSAGMGEMVAQMAVMAPVLRRSLEELERSMEHVTRDFERRMERHDYGR
jgi:hypothetical protein